MYYNYVKIKYFITSKGIRPWHKKPWTNIEYKIPFSKQIKLFTSSKKIRNPIDKNYISNDIKYNNSKIIIYIM